MVSNGTRGKVVLLVSLLLVMVVLGLLVTVDLPCSQSPPLESISITTCFGSIDMVVAWAGRPTMEREQAKSRHLSGRSREDGPDGPDGPDVRPCIDASPVRYRYNGELSILIRRAFVYGSHWIRNIHILMPDECESPDDLIRSALGDTYATLSPRVHVHRDSTVLPADAVPSFSSHPKEANLDRIPGLSEQFVYANDDMFLNRTTPLGMFFASDGTPRYRRDDVQPACLDRGQKRSSVGQHVQAVYPSIQHNTAALFWDSPMGQTAQAQSYIEVEHQMKPLTRSGYRRARALFPAEFEQLTHTRFRSADDFSPTNLVANLELASGHATIDTHPPHSHQLYVDVDTFPTAQRNLRIIQGRLQRCYLLCLNNASLDWHGPWMTRNFDLACMLLISNS